MSHVGTHRYVWLDGMRGLAALAVVLHHALSPFGLQKLWIPHAQLAVDFFFCMSGFVVAAAYQRRRESGLGFLDLMRRRWQRLYPMALCGIALGAVALLGRGEVNGQTLVSLGFNLMLQPDYSAWWRGSGPTWASNVAIWSVWIELLLSAAFAAWAWRASNRALLVALMLAAIEIGRAHV